MLKELDPEGTLVRIDELLEARHRSGDLGNLQDVLAETVFILLSRQTRGPVYQRLFADLRQRFPTWWAVLNSGTEELEGILKPGGFHRQRAQQLRQLLEIVARKNDELRVGPFSAEGGDLTLEFLRSWSDRQAEEFLLELPGIGPKSARCVLSYALGRPAFAVDTHVHRILTRLGIVDSRGRKADHDPFQQAVPKRMRLRLHVNLVHHGREICRSRNEKCGECVLVSFCERGRQRVRDERPVAVDLFAGAGGMALGFKRSGFRIGLAVEPDRNAAQTYRLNHPGTPVVEAYIDSRTRGADIHRLLPAGTEVSALIAGPPCQGYSAGGRRKPEASSNTLFRHVSRLARQLKPEFVVLENVPGIRSVSGHGFLLPIQTSLESAGLHVAPHLLRASDYGVAQRRLRYFFLGRRRRRGVRAAPAPPEPTHTRAQESPGAPNGKPVTDTVLEALSVIPALPHGVVAEPYYVAEDGTEYSNMSTMKHAPHVLAKIARIDPGEGPLSYRRLDHVEAATIIAGHRAMPVHPELDRTISVREAALLQGFPVDYQFLGPRSSQPLQVANAVPPPLAEAVAGELAGLLSAGATSNHDRLTP